MQCATLGNKQVPKHRPFYMHGAKVDEARTMLRKLLFMHLDKSRFNQMVS